MNRRNCILLIVLLFNAWKAYTQEGMPALNDTVQVHKELISTDAPPVMAKKWNQVKTKYFTMNIGLAILLDYNTVVQDDNNLEQVGKIEPATEFRGDRLILTGQLLFFKNPWRYMVGANYNGLDAPQGNTTYSFLDWSLDIPLGKTGGWFTLGKQKEGVGYEYCAPGSQLLFTERGSGAPALVRQRNIGIRFSNSVFHQRLIFTVGAFNNYWETGKSFSENGSQLIGRVVYLPMYKSDRKLLHVGVAYRYSDASDEALSFKGKPEANTAPYFFNTGSLSASASRSLMLELITVQGPVSFVGEYMNCGVQGGIVDIGFQYVQLGASWFITGENRRYNRQSGVLGKLIPKRNFNFTKGAGLGAWEVGARYTYSDFTEQDIDGGEFARVTAALGWYPNAHFRVELNYGIGTLKKDALEGESHFWQFRTQFEL